MYTQRIKLKVSKQQKYQLNKLFFIAYKIHIICVKYAQKQLRLLYRNSRYRYLIHLYGIYKQNKIPYPYKEELKNIIDCYDLNRNKLEKHLKIQSSKYRHILTSSQVQCIADNVAQSVNKCLYDNGKGIHIKKFTEFNTISQKVFNGFKYNGYDVIYKREQYKLKYKNINKDTLRTIELQRIEFNSGYEYYINFIIDEPQPIRLTTGSSECGIDTGVSIEAICTNNCCMLEELAPKNKDYNRQIAKLQKQLSQSIISTNPTNKDGTFKKGIKLKLSKHAKYLKRKIRVLYRKKISIHKVYA